jgi:hypothetical protein
MPYGTPPRAQQLVEHGRFNRFLATLPLHDFSLLAPHLRTSRLERGVMLHDVGEEIEHVYFPHSGMVSLVAVMQSGATVETATIGRSGVHRRERQARGPLDLRAGNRAIAGTAAWLSALLGQVQQSVACNALHAIEARLCADRISRQYAPDCVNPDGHWPVFGVATGASRRIGAQYPPLSR